MFELIPGKLSIKDISELLQSDTQIKLKKTAYNKIEKSFLIVQEIIKQDRSVYGINTGFGLLASKKIKKEELKDLQRRIVLSHAAGVGEKLDDDIVKLIMLLKINSLAQGYSGVSIELVDTLIEMYNHGIYPVIPSQGSVGASGDLAPLAHMSMTIMGEGDAIYKGELLTSEEALYQAGITPVELREKEGLALLNGTQVSTAIALYGLMKAQVNFTLATIAGAISIDAIQGSIKPFSRFIHEAKNSKEQLEFASIMSDIIKDSEILYSHINCLRVQDPYSIRCQPQVMGAVLRHFRSSQENLVNEANGVSDNPLICPDTGEIVSGGNFHAEMTAISADVITIACSEIGAISERRMSLLIDQNLSGLPPFLIKDPGLNSGFMLAHVTASALASENKTLSHPASVDSLPTSANQEDHVSMATFGANKLVKVAENVLNIVAIETLAACQGVDFRAPLKTSETLQRQIGLIRNEISFYDKDRFFAKDINKAREIISRPSYYKWLREKIFGY